MKIIWQAYDTKNYTGGPIINALRVLPELKRRGHEVLAVIEYDHEHPNADQLRALGVECYTFSTPRYSEEHVKRYLEQIVAFKPDIFVSNVSVHAGLAGHWAVRWGIPVVHTHRSDDPLNNGMAEFFFTGEQKWRLSALVVVNRYLAKKIQALTTTPIPYEIIPSGVPLSPFKAEQSNNTKLRVVYSGRLVEKQKRISDVVRAFISVAKLSTDIEFSIIGSGDTHLIESLKQLISKESLENRFRFTGKLYSDEYKKELSNHHIIVLLSDYEGIPGSLMDGMSCGLVPVVYGINGIEELVIDKVNGVVVNDRSESFFKAILELKNDDKLRAELSSKALRTIAAKFSLEFAVDEWENLFLRLRDRIGIENHCPMKVPTRLDLFRSHPLLLQYRGKPGIKEILLNRLKRLGRWKNKRNT
jgi:glycosyltransferase involved in cell wall biosynthesis